MKNIKNVVMMLSVQIANYAFPLITIPIVSRSFGPENIGIINFITAIVAYFTLVVNYSFNYTGIRRLSKEKEVEKTVYWDIFYSKLFLFALCSVVFLFCLIFIPEINKNIQLSIIVYSSCLAAVFSQNWFLQAKENFKILVRISFFTKFLSFIMIFLFIKKSSDILLYASIVNLVNLAIGIFIFIYCVIKYQLNHQKIKFIKIINYLQADKFLFFSLMIISLYTTVGIMFLGFFSSSIAIGYYTSAQKVIDVGRNLIVFPVSQVIYPILSKKFHDNKQAGIDSVRKILPIFSFLIIIFLVFLNLFKVEIVSILFGSEFQPVSYLLSILSFGLACVFYSNIIANQIMLNLGMDKAMLYIQIIVTIISVALNFYLTSSYGEIGTAYIWSVTEFVILVYQLIYLRCKGISIIGSYLFNPINIISSIKFILKK